MSGSRQHFGIYTFSQSFSDGIDYSSIHILFPILFYLFQIKDFPKAIYDPDNEMPTYQYPSAKTGMNEQYFPPTHIVR